MSMTAMKTMIVLGVVSVLVSTIFFILLLGSGQSVFAPLGTGICSISLIAIAGFRLRRMRKNHV